MAEQFTAPVTISVYEAALQWFGKNPHEGFQQYGDYGWIILLTRDREVRDVACTILSAIEARELPAVRRSYLSGIPRSFAETLGSMPGTLDPHKTTVTLEALALFAKTSGEAPQFLAHVVPEPVSDPVPDRITHTGAPGRPSAMHLIKKELCRRSEAGELAESRAKQAEALHNWIEGAHEDLLPPTTKTIANFLSKDGLFRRLKGNSPK